MSARPASEAIQAHAARIAASWQPLTEQQRTTLATILNPAPARAAVDRCAA